MFKRGEIPGSFQVTLNSLIWIVLILLLALPGLLACTNQPNPAAEASPPTPSAPEQLTGAVALATPGEAEEGTSPASEPSSPAPATVALPSGSPTVVPPNDSTASGAPTPTAVPPPTATPTPTADLPVVVPITSATQTYKDNCEFTDHVVVPVQGDAESAKGAEAGTDIDVLWRFTEADNEGVLHHLGAVENHPVIEEGIIYFGAAATGCLYAIDASTGESLWVHRGGDEIRSSPSVADGIVYVSLTRKQSSKGAQVHALHSKTGAVLWQYGTSGSRVTSPFLNDGKVYFGVNDSPTLRHRVIALDALTGNFLWNQSAANRIYGVLADDDKVYFTTWEGQLFALDDFTLTVLWHRRLEHPGNPYPTLYEDKLLLASGRNGFMALDKKSGAILWEKELEDALTSQPLANSRVMYLATRPHNFYALDITTGEILWQTGYERGELGSPAMFDGHIVVGTEEGAILTVSAETGRLLRSRSAGFPVYTRPLITGKTIVFSNQNDVLSAFEPEALPADEEPVPDNQPWEGSDALLWSAYTGTPLFTGPRVQGDRLFLVVPADEAVSGERIVAVNKNNGEILWSADDQGETLMTWLALGEEAVFLPSSRERMAARDIETGELLWEYHAGSAVPAFPLVGDNTVFLKTEDNYLHAVDRFTGDLRWKFDTRVTRAVWPNESDGLAYFGAIGIYALDERTGEERWHRATRSGFSGFPFLSGDFLCFSTEKNSVAALDRWTGNSAWEHKLDGQPLTLTVTDGMAYAATWGEKVYAIEVESGMMLWSAELDIGISSGPRVTAVGGVVIAGTIYNGYTVFDAATGQELWKNEVQKNRRKLPWPTVSEGVAFIGPNFFELVSHDLRTGEILEKYYTSDIRSSTPVISEGVAYLHSYDGYTYALDVSDAFNK